MQIIQVKTTAEKQMLDITSKIQAFIHEKGWKDGLLTVYVPHTTAGITINENTDPHVQHDLLAHMESMVPRDHRFLHAEGNSDAHIMMSLVGTSEQVILENGRLMMGTWQGIYFCEFDGPRDRKVYVKFIEG